MDKNSGSDRESIQEGKHPQSRKYIFILQVNNFKSQKSEFEGHFKVKDGNIQKSSPPCTLDGSPQKKQ